MPGVTHVIVIQRSRLAEVLLPELIEKIEDLIV